MDSMHLKDLAIGQRARKALNEAMSAARSAKGSVATLQSTAPVSASSAIEQFGSAQAAVNDAAARKSPFVFDQDTVLTGDVLISSPVHIVVPVGVTVSMTNFPTLQHYAENESGDRYAGMFSLRDGAESSVFEVWGVFAAPTQAQPNEIICPVLEYGMEGHAHYLGSPIVLGMPAGRIAVLSSTLVTDWGGGVLGPQGPWMN